MRGLFGLSAFAFKPLSFFSFSLSLCQFVRGITLSQSRQVFSGAEVSV